MSTYEGKKAKCFIAANMQIDGQGKRKDPHADPSKYTLIILGYIHRFENNLLTFFGA